MSKETKGFAQQTDEQLLEKLRGRDEEVLEYLTEKYKGLVRTLANQYYLAGGDKEDLVQEGMIGLFKAIRDYRPDRNASFYSFAVLCIKRSLYTAITRSQSKSNRPLNEYISLSADVDADMSEKEGTQTLLDALEAESAFTPEQVVLDQDFLNDFAQQSTEHLSETEYKVMNLLLEGKTYQEIAQILSVSPKSADNAIQRCRQKLKKILAKI